LQSEQYKIIIVAYWYDRRFKKRVGGLIRMFELADNLKKSGHDVTIILPKIGYPKQQTTASVVEIPIIDCFFLRPASFHLIGNLAVFLQLIRRPSIVYIRQMNSFLTLLIANLFKIPTVYEIPNDPYLQYPSMKGLKRWVIKKIDKYCMALADKIIVLSDWSKNRINRFDKVPLTKICVMPSGTDTKLFRPLDKIRCCEQIGMDPELINIGFVGSFLKHQGVDILIDAAPVLLKKYNNLKFILIGDGPMSLAWKRKVNRKNLQSAFIFTGHIRYQRIPIYIGAMDICVAPHGKGTNQASPVKLFDYMACAKPIVASDIEVVNEIIGDSGCALLFPAEQPDKLAQVIISIIEDPNKRAEMGTIGRQHVLQNYDRENMTQTWNKIFASMDVGS
jgi:glycosyltransferase involved in cell wall biosynthesis